jgi:hypothetical protein
LIYEFALTPGVFDPSLCLNRDQWELQLRYLAKGIMTDGLIADLQEGEWSKFIQRKQAEGSLHLKAKELLRKLRENNRLRSRLSCETDSCFVDSEWLAEALSSHEQEAFQGIITSQTTCDSFSTPAHVQSVERIHLSDWWAGRGHSRVLMRYATDYLETLRPILRQANSLMFIDRFIDPNEPRYQTIPQMMAIAISRTTSRSYPRVEVHRACYDGTGEQRTFPTEDDLIRRFSLPDWRKYSFEVYVWDDFHERHLISELCGIHLGAGFDASHVSVTHQTTTWTRLDREVRDQIQREFDPASNVHKLRYRFRIN